VPPRPRLTFFCELGGAALLPLLSEAVLDDLAALGASVSMACLDLGAARAAAVRALDRRGIAVSAWLVAPRERGYFATADNPDAIAAAYQELRDFAAREGLRFDGVGLDVEMPIERMQALAAAPLRLVLPALLGATRGAHVRRAERAYGELIARIRADGLRVDSYQLPPVVDARAVRSSLMARAFGMLELAVDREVLMLYSSALPLGAGWLASYARSAQAIGVGVAGSGAVVVPQIAWPDLARDLRLAAAASREVYLFSLEGCVERGMMPALRDFDWEVPPEVPRMRARVLDLLRLALRVGLRAEAMAARALGAWRSRPGR